MSLALLVALAGCGGRANVDGSDGSSPGSHAAQAGASSTSVVGPTPERDAGPSSDPQLEPDASADSGSAVDAGAALGAGGDGDASGERDAGPGLSNAYDGIYRIDAMTLNSSSCAAGGTSILASQTQPLFIVQKGILADPDLLMLVSCSNLQDCRSKAQQEASSGSVSDAGWVYSVNAIGTFDAGTTLTPAARGSSVCSGEMLQQASVTGDPGVSFRIEVQIRVVPDHSPDAGGCSFAAAEAAASGVACSRFEVITGRFQQSL